MNSYFGPFLNGVPYCPPGASPGFNNIRDDLSMMALHHIGKPIFLFGDFHPPGMDWKTSAATCLGSTISSNFVDLCFSFNLTQLFLSLPESPTLALMLLIWNI